MDELLTSTRKLLPKGAAQPPGLRIGSVDLLRATTMFLMVFVNDVGEKVPRWLRHAAASEDYLGFADIIFPAFLVIVGLSLPLALQNRERKGDTIPQRFWYILVRAASLIIMGFYHVNLENYSAAAAVARPVWQMLITVCFFLVWLDYPRDWRPAKSRLFKLAGILGLVLLAWLYEGGTRESPAGMQMHWGGILGLIGWAYLIAALVYLFSGGQMIAVAIACLLLLTLNILAHPGYAHLSVFPIGDGSSALLTMAGVLTTLVYLRLRNHPQGGNWMGFLVAGPTLVAAGLLIRPFAEGISKIRSTPAWVLICMGITVFAFGIFVRQIDVRQKTNAFALLKPAGTSTLTCYLLPYIIYALYSLIDVQFPGFLRQGLGAIIKSLVFAFIVVQLTGWLERRRIRLQL